MQNHRRHNDNKQKADHHYDDFIKIVQATCSIEHTKCEYIKKNTQHQLYIYLFIITNGIVKKKYREEECA